MFLNRIIIICILPLSFCQELQNQNVGQIRYRIKRVPDKKLDDVRQLIKDKYNSRLPMKDKPVINPILKPLISISNTIPKNNVQSSTKAVNKPVSQKSPLNYNIPKKINIVKLQNGLMKDNFKSKSAKVVDDTKHGSLKNPHRFTEDADDDTIVPDKTNQSITTVKPQLTTQIQKVDTQIEKPVLDKNEILDEKSEKNKSLDLEDHLTNKEKNIASEDNLNNFDYDEIDVVLNNTNFYKPDDSGDKTEDIPLNNFTNNRNSELETRNADHKNETFDVEQLKIKKEDRLNNDDRQIDADKPFINLSQNVRKTVLLPSKRKETKNVPLVSKSSLEEEFNLGESKKSDDNIKKLPSKLMTGEIRFRNNDLKEVPKSPDSVENESFDVIEIKHHNFTEVLERKTPSLDDSEPVYVKPTSNSPFVGYEVNYNPAISYVQSPYGYPYSNYQESSFYYKNYPYLNSVPKKTNVDALNKIWRTWVGTEVVIKSKKNPNLSPLSNYQIPAKKFYYNNFASENANPNYTSYPCYVYPNNRYASTYGYYNGNAY